jgi:hypothetical protein
MNSILSLVFSVLTTACLLCNPVSVAQEASETKDEPAVEKTDDPVTADTKIWKAIKPTGARAAFKMPVKPRFIERTFTPVVNEPPIKVRMHLASANKGSVAFVFNYHDLHQAPETPQAITKILQGAVIGSIANVIGREISQKQIRYNEFQGMEFVYQYAQHDKIYRVSARAFVAGQRQYQISCLMEADQFDEELVNAFLNTFRILPAEPEQEDSPAATEEETESSGEKPVEQANDSE